MDDLITQCIIENLLELVNKNTCCIFFIGPFYKLRFEIDREIQKFGLKSHDHIINGQFIKRIYNSLCCHCIDNQPSFHLADQSKKEILYFLKFSGNNERSQDARLPSIFKSTRLVPVLPANRFTIAPLRPNTFHSDVGCREMVPRSWRIYQFKWDIMKRIHENRVLVINGDTSFDKSTAVPLTIVEECIARQGYSKVLCVESDNLMAILNSNFIADHLNERIGSRVGFQVYLQSRVCDNTNIIYTTAIFFLRVLMGQDPRESFRYISHIVISDVHLHNAFKDIFMKELKNVLPHYPSIKIILLSDSNGNNKFLSYFGEGQELRLNLQQQKPLVYHLEQITELIKQNESPQKSFVEEISSQKNIRQIADEALEYYHALGDETAFENLLQLFKCQRISINHVHSKGGYTALISAVKHDNPLHVKWLLTYHKANPCHQDKFKINALEYAISINSLNCIEALTNQSNFEKLEQNPPPIDFEMIIKLIRLLANPRMTTPTSAFGNILVFLPTFDYLLKLHYAILKNQFLCKIHKHFHVHLIHSNMQPEQLQQILVNRCPGKIILTTEVAEYIANLNDISFVIDSGQIFREKVDPNFRCSNFTNEWISRESFERRSLIASRFTSGYCFRLISQKIHDKLNPVCPAELCYVPLNRLALTIKLLSPGCVLSDYFQETISKPPAEHVAQSIAFLKNIEALDDTLAVTWLGCRLIDIPMNLELGKSLVMSILFKCLDPVLTIVSFLTYSSCLRLFKYICAPRRRRQLDSPDCLEDCYSDHLEFLQLYHHWQDEKRTKSAGNVIADERTYILNGILENICELRTNLVGAIRSSQLIHNQGILSMHSINLKANNWAIIKASLAAGLYPKYCMINLIDGNIKSKTTKLCIDSSSVLRPSRILTHKSSPPSNWIVYFRETNRISLNRISNCSLISSATIALFAGKSEINPKNIFFTEKQAVYFLDSNIWLLCDSQSVLLTLRLREIFNESYLDYLQNCGNIEKWKKTHEMTNVFDVIGKILLQEDRQANFPQPYRVGSRPKAFVNKFTSSEFDFSSNDQRAFESMLPLDRQLEKEFFFISMFDSQLVTSFGKLPTNNIMEDPHFKSLSLMMSMEKMTFVVVCSANRKQITNLALVRFDQGGVVLRNCFHVNVPLHEVIITCTTLGLGVPPLTPDSIPRKIRKEIGEIILELWEYQDK